VRAPIGLAAAILIALSGCGGGDDETQTTAPTPTAPASAQGKAVADFAAATQAYWDEFRNCGSGATATRDYFAGCTRSTRRDFRLAETRALRALERSKAAACRHARDLLREVMAHVVATVERTVVAFDRSNNASLEKSTYSGPAPQQLFLSGQQAIDEDLPKARELSRTIDAGC
jgi:hypothetical protein